MKKKFEKFFKLIFGEIGFVLEQVAVYRDLLQDNVRSVFRDSINISNRTGFGNN